MNVTVVVSWKKQIARGTRVNFECKQIYELYRCDIFGDIQINMIKCMSILLLCMVGLER